MPDNRSSRGKSCPTCGRPAVVAYRPFCSRRCAAVDLGRWLRGDYAIPAVEPPDGFDDGEGVSSSTWDHGEDRND